MTATMTLTPVAPPASSAAGDPVDTASMSLRTGDGHMLSARAYEPRTPPRRAVLIAPAMGVPQRFYEPLACWLAAQGVAMMTFDFRGQGESAPPSLRGFKASITEWATQDLPAAADALCMRWPDLPRTFLGHSLGGQIFGWLEGHERFERVVTVASGNGHWRYNAPRMKHKAWALWWLLAPVGIALAGYFPGKRLGAIGDLPAGVMWQWRRWCLHRDYLGAEGAALRLRYAQVRTPIRAVVLEDDELLSPDGIRRLYRLYACAPVQFESLRPEAFGQRFIGHFGVFKPWAAAALWPRLLHWIEG